MSRVSCFGDWKGLDIVQGQRAIAAKPFVFPLLFPFCLKTAKAGRQEPS